MKKIGIDTGVQTGVAIWCSELRKFDFIKTLKIHNAMRLVEIMQEEIPLFVFVEDARLATFGRAKDMHKAQGAGSVKRDAVIWEDFLTELQIPFKLVRPKKSITKLDDALFKKITGYAGKTSQHARDAAMLVFQK